MSAAASAADPANEQPAAFEPVPLPSAPAGKATAESLGPQLRRWVSSPPLRALAEASGWDWPRCADTGDLLARLADLSRDWDFRARAGGRERNFIGTDPADVNGRVIDENLVMAAALALGMVSAAPVPGGRDSSLVVLSGLVSACVNRTRYAAALLADGLAGGLAGGSAVVLGGHRELAGKEPAQASELGLGSLFDEAEAVVAATRQAFRLAGPATSEEPGPRPDRWNNALWGASARYRWPGVDVLIAPSSEPATRRANTVDQLRHWARLAGVGDGDQVVLLTTQIYVPFQQLAGIRVLGLERGCRMYCCGVDAANSFLPASRHSGRSYLQEVRSALRAASELMAAARKADG